MRNEGLGSLTEMAHVGTVHPGTVPPVQPLQAFSLAFIIHLDETMYDIYHDSEQTRPTYVPKLM